MRLRRWRDPRDDERPRTAERVAWLAGDGAREALAEALGSGEVDAEAHRWIERQAAHVVREASNEDARRWMRQELGEAELPGGTPLYFADELGALALSDDPAHRDATGSGLAAALRPLAGRLVERSLAAERAARPEAALDFGGLGPAHAETKLEGAAATEAKLETDRVAAARAFLEHTVDAADDAVAWQVRGLGVGRPVPWHALVRGLRARELGAPTLTRARLHRVAAVWRRLGFEDDMNARMRAESDRGGVLPFASVACLHAPRDVRVAQLPRDWGVLADACAAQGVARALAQALALPTHPAELRWLLPGGVAGALGALALQLWAEREQLVRLQGLTRTEAERVARVAGAFSLLVTRAWAALATAPLDDARGAGRRMELLATVLGEALRCDVSPAVAALVGADARAAQSRSLEHLGGLALAAGLRERHDEDWFLDPRVEETIRGAGQRGNALSIEALCEELRVELGAAAARANELVA